MHGQNHGTKQIMGNKNTRKSGVRIPKIQKKIRSKAFSLIRNHHLHKPFHFSHVLGRWCFPRERKEHFCHCGVAVLMRRLQLCVWIVCLLVRSQKHLIVFRHVFLGYLVQRRIQVWEQPCKDRIVLGSFTSSIVLGASIFSITDMSTGVVFDGHEDMMTVFYMEGL